MEINSLIQLLNELRGYHPVINSYATLGHLNVRKVGPDQERVLAFDIKLTDVIISTGTFARLVGCDSWHTAEISLWDANDFPRFPLLGPLTAQSGLHQCMVAMGKKLVLKDVDVRKFKFELRDAKVIEGEFSMTVNNPSNGITSMLADMVTELIPVTIYESQEELGFTETPTAEDPPEEPLEWLPPKDETDLPPLYGDAMRLCVKTGRASVSAIQRNLRIGYNQAHKIMQALEETNVVSAINDRGVREVLLGPEDLECDDTGDAAEEAGR